MPKEERLRQLNQSEATIEKGLKYVNQFETPNEERLRQLNRSEAPSGKGLKYDEQLQSSRK